MTEKFSHYVKSIIGAYKFYFFSLLLLYMVAGLFHISVNYKLKEIIDTIATNSNANVTTLLLLLIFYKFMNHGVFFLGRLLEIRYNPLLLSKIIEDMYTKTLRHSLHWFDSHLSGEISSKISDFQTNFLNLVYHICRSFGTLSVIFLGLLFLFKINTLSGVVLFLFLAIYAPIISYLLKNK